MIVVTGGLGFIGQNLVKELTKRGYLGVVVLDTKTESLESIQEWLSSHAKDINAVFHLGAITDTTVMDRSLFDEFNVEASMFIWNICTDYHIPLIFASSAATYGDGEEGFDDKKDILSLKPLNPYGWSKQQFDVWVMQQERTPWFWAGLKFFNVYGHGEKDKDSMASVVFHTYNQINESGGMKLFKSHNLNYKNGEQSRDFVYVDDVVDVCIWLFENKPKSGIYNVGTGKARTFNDLSKSVFKTLGIEEKISYIDTPIKIRNKYQYFTEALIDKLREAGYKKPFHELEDGVLKYINKLRYENC